MLLKRSPEYWAREASIEELQSEVRKLSSWTERAAEILDFVYIERSMRLLRRAQEGSKDDALALVDHLERVAHDSIASELATLDRPYFARWRLLAEIMQRCAMQLAVPHKVLDRKHVRDILLRLNAAGGRVVQGDLTMISNEGQRSATLKLMEQWDLIDRRADGASRMVSITDLGRLAITEEIADEAAHLRPRSTLQRGCMYLSAAS